jgi:hypothetical protein
LLLVASVDLTGAATASEPLSGSHEGGTREGLPAVLREIDDEGNLRAGGALALSERDMSVACADTLSSAHALAATTGSSNDVSPNATQLPREKPK